MPIKNDLVSATSVSYLFISIETTGVPSTLPQASITKLNSTFDSLPAGNKAASPIDFAAMSLLFDVTSSACKNAIPVCASLITTCEPNVG